MSIGTYTQISFKLASLLLLKKKEVSFTELEALPTVKNEADVEEIIDYLTSHFNAEKTTLKKSALKKILR